MTLAASQVDDVVIFEGSTIELVFLTVGGLLTLALLVAFIIFLVRQRGK